MLKSEIEYLYYQHSNTTSQENRKNTYSDNELNHFLMEIQS